MIFVIRHLIVYKHCVQNTWRAADQGGKPLIDSSSVTSMPVCMLKQAATCCMLNIMHAYSMQKATHEAGYCSCNGTLQVSRESTSILPPG